MANRPKEVAIAPESSQSDCSLRFENGMRLADLSLAALVTHPDFSMYCSTERQIRDRESSVQPTSERPIVATIDAWHLITLHLHTLDQLVVHLVGPVRGTTRIRVTSPVAAVDRDRCLVKTKNSIYAIGNRADGEPDLPTLLTIVSVFQAWGVANALGMPPISFGGFV